SIDVGGWGEGVLRPRLRSVRGLVAHQFGCFPQLVAPRGQLPRGLGWARCVATRLTTCLTTITPVNLPEGTWAGDQGRPPKLPGIHPWTPLGHQFTGKTMGFAVCTMENRGQSGVWVPLTDIDRCQVSQSELGWGHD